MKNLNNKIICYNQRTHKVVNLISLYLRYLKMLLVALTIIKSLQLHIRPIITYLSINAHETYNWFRVNSFSFVFHNSAYYTCVFICLYLCYNIIFFKITIRHFSHYKMLQKKGKDYITPSYSLSSFILLRRRAQQ